METIEYEGVTLRRWTVGPSTFLAMPETGARLLNWNITMADDTVRDVIYWPHEQADYSKPAGIRGGNPILFPFCARTFDGQEEGYWRDPVTKERRPMQRHGYARDGSFEVEKLDDTGFVALFEPSDACREAYPYEYEFRVRYRFSQLAFRVDLLLENKGNVPLPWSAGHHFYFQLPWHEGLSRKDYVLQLPAKKAFYHGGDGALHKAEASPKTTFDDPAIIDRIHCKLTEATMRFGPAGGEENVGIRIGTDPVPAPYTTVVTWTENEDSPFYCVEPWMGPPNSPAHRNGLHYVEPGKEGAFTVEVALL